MENKHTGALSGVGFYATLAICLLAVGVGGYFLLFGGQETAQEEEEAPQTAVTAQAPEIPAEDPVETVSPAELADIRQRLEAIEIAGARYNEDMERLTNR